MKARVTDRDLGMKKIMRSIGSMGGAATHVGIQGTEGEEQHEGFASTNLDIGTIHEFGGPKTKERSFIRASFNEKQDTYQRKLGVLVGKAVDGTMRVEQALGILGESVRADMVRFIDTGKAQPPLAQSTIERKGSSTPLVDTGQLKRSITHVEESK